MQAALNANGHNEEGCGAVLGKLHIA